MKNLITTTIYFLLLILPTTAFSQNWRLGGNTIFPFGGANSVNATNNIIGTDATANFPIRFETFGTQRMYIANGGATNGFVGIGSNFSSPFSLLHVNGVNNATGNLFQTTSDENLINRWVMSVEGGDPPPERFYIENPGGTVATTYNIDMGVVKNGDLNFRTNTSFTGGNISVIFKRGGGDLVHGRVAMGNDLPLGFFPESRLHLHKTIELFTLQSI